MSLKFCIRKNDEKTLWNCIDRWIELDALKQKDLYAYKDGNTQKKNGSINFSLYQEAFEYVKNKSLEDIGFMKKISDFRDQSKGQLNKILSDSSIQTFNITKNHSTKAPITSDLQNVVNQLLDQTVSKAEFAEQKNELSEIKQMVLELSKIVKNQATSKQ